MIKRSSADLFGLGGKGTYSVWEEGGWVRDRLTPET